MYNSSSNKCRSQSNMKVNIIIISLICCVTCTEIFGQKIITWSDVRFTEEYSVKWTQSAACFSRLTMVLVRMHIVCTEQQRQGERAL
jgi:hypothetical protein